MKITTITMQFIRQMGHTFGYYLDYSSPTFEVNQSESQLYRCLGQTNL